MLQQAAGYLGRDREFAELMSILDQELRMATPVDAEGLADLQPEPPRSEGERHYQLTHDFLVPPLRQWLTRNQRETRKGRAELCLAERTALWTKKPESKQLPSRSEWVAIRSLTRRASWTDPQARMMKAAGFYHVSRLALLLGLCALLSAAALFASRRLHERTVMLEFRELPRTDLRYLSDELDRLEPDHDIWAAYAERVVQDQRGDIEDRTRAAAALARHSPDHVDLLFTRLLETGVPEHIFLRSELLQWRQRFGPALWRVASDSSRKPAAGDYPPRPLWQPTIRAAAAGKKSPPRSSAT